MNTRPALEDLIQALHAALEDLDRLPRTRSLALARTKLEEAKFWVENELRGEP